MIAKPVRVLALLLFVGCFTPSRAICYYPNGDASPQDLPCHDGTDHSTCCGPGYACLSNNICMATGLERQLPNAAKYDRGSCTDKTWRSSQCPNFCVNSAHGDTLDGGIGMAKCPGIKDMYYCMDGFPFDCTSGDNVLSFSGTPTAITTIGFAPSTSTSISTSPTSTASTASTSASSSTTSSSSSSPISTSSSSTSSPSPATSTASPSQPVVPVNQSSSSPSTGLIAGVAAGATIGVIGLAAAGFMAYRRHQAKRQTPTTRPPPDESFAFQHPRAQIRTDNEYKKAYDSLHAAYPPQPPVFELPVERPRTPELPTHWR